MLLDDLAAVSETVAATSARGAKVEALAGGLRAASPEEQQRVRHLAGLPAGPKALLEGHALAVRNPPEVRHPKL